MLKRLAIRPTILYTYYTLVLRHANVDYYSPGTLTM